MVGKRCRENILEGQGWTYSRRDGKGRRDVAFLEGLENLGGGEGNSKSSSCRDKSNDEGNFINVPYEAFLVSWIRLEYKKFGS